MSSFFTRVGRQRISSRGSPAPHVPTQGVPFALLILIGWRLGALPNSGNKLRAFRPLASTIKEADDNLHAPLVKSHFGALRSRNDFAAEVLRRAQFTEVWQ